MLQICVKKKKEENFYVDSSEVMLKQLVEEELLSYELVCSKF